MILDENKKNKLLSLPVGERTDHVLYYLLAPHMLGYWTFLKPKSKGREISDTMLIFGDVCILFEAKTRQSQRPTSDQWVRSKLKEAVEQLMRNAGMLSKGEVPEVRNKWRGIVKWASLGIKHYYGMVVMFHESEPYDPRDLAAEVFNSASIPIQVISLQDFSQLLRFINTPWDFIVYYEFRNLFGKEYLLPVHQEQSIYWGIIREWCSLARLHMTKLPDAELAKDKEFIRTYSKVITKSPDIPLNIYEDVAASYLIDIAAGSISHKADVDLTGKRVGSHDHNIFLLLMEAITELSRRRRQAYGSFWVNLAKESQRTGRPSHKAAISPSRNRCYIMLANNGNKFDESDLVNLCHIEMQSQRADSCLGLMATARNILDTHQSLLASLRSGSEVFNDIEPILDTKAVFVKNDSITTTNSVADKGQI